MTSPRLGSSSSPRLAAHCQECACRHVLRLGRHGCTPHLSEARRAPFQPSPSQLRLPGRRGKGSLVGVPASRVKAAILCQGCGSDTAFELLSAKLHSARCCARQPQPSSPFLCDHNHRRAVDASREERTGPSLCNFFISAAWSHN